MESLFGLGRHYTSFLEFMVINLLQNSGMSLWIDVICINQGNVDEGNHQISIRGEIFKSAQEVNVWLSLGEGDSNYLS